MRRCGSRGGGPAKRKLTGAGLALSILLGGLLLPAPIGRAQALEPGVTKQVLSGPGPYVSGDPLEFQIVVTNLDPLETVQVELNDYMDANWVDPSFVPVTSTSDPGDSSCSAVFESGGVGWRVTCDHVGIQPGEDWVVTIEVRADPTACLTAIQTPAADPKTNVLTWSWTTGTESGTGRTEVPIDFRAPDCDFSVEKFASPRNLRPGDPVTFTIRVTNIGGTYRRYDGFWHSSVLFDVLSPAFEDVALASAAPDYNCAIQPYAGAPPPFLSFLPTEPGTLLLCLSPSRDATWRFPAGETIEFQVTARLRDRWGDCDPIANTAGFYFGFEIDAGRHRYGLVRTGSRSVNVVCRSTPPSGSPPGPASETAETGAPMLELALLALLGAVSGVTLLGLGRGRGPRRTNG
jgi:hypothetical protein